jgi:preprotein translocase subunit SecG
MGASMSQASRSFFGSSGSKGFFYTATKWLIALFFILALSLTAVEFKTQHQQEVKLPFLAKASKTSTEK